MAKPQDTAADPAPRKPGRRGSDSKSSAPKRSGRLAAGLALVFATIALIGTSYMGYLINSKRGLTDAKGRLFQVERDTAELEQQTAKMSDELDSLHSTQTTLTEGLKALHGEIGKGRRAWLLAETENLLIIAQHRLSYARDVRVARETLRAADRQLAQLGDPDYQPVRKQIETEIAALEAFEKLDPAGQAQRLVRLAGRIEQLPFAPEVRPAPAGTPGNAGLWQELRRDLQGLVRIRSTADAPRPFLLPEQRYFLRENLRLLLLGAQLALLQGDTVTFEQNTRSAQQWLRSYYHTGEASVQAALDELDKVLALRAVARPELGAALKTLQDLRARPSS